MSIDLSGALSRFKVAYANDPSFMGPGSWSEAPADPEQRSWELFLHFLYSLGAITDDDRHAWQLENTQP